MATMSSKAHSLATTFSATCASPPSLPAPTDNSRARDATGSARVPPSSVLCTHHTHARAHTHACARAHGASRHTVYLSRGKLLKYSSHEGIPVEPPRPSPPPPPHHRFAAVETNPARNKLLTSSAPDL